MRITICLLFSLFSLGVFAQNAPNAVDENGNKTGPWVAKWKNGEIKYEGVFKNGHPVGEFKRYSDRGKLMAVMNYSEDGSTASAHLYRPNKKVLASGVYVNQKKDSLWRFYDTEGKLFLEEHYKNGIQHGPSKEYYPNGNVHFKRNYENGKIVGEYKEYYTNGALRSKKTYVQGIPEGNLVIYHQNGVYKVIGKYKRGIKNGNWRFYDERAKIVKEENYENGTMTYTSEDLISYWNDSIRNIRTIEKFNKNGVSVFKAFYPDGQIYREGTFWKGQKDSVWNYYTQSGRLDTIRTFHRGKRQGPWTYKYPNGNVKIEEAWYLDRREGEYMEFYPDGTKKVVGNYHKGNKSGKWSYFNEKGELIETKEFK
jgi:antitoxin component YwqK of YwqJK toxin-antitoxin module